MGTVIAEKSFHLMLELSFLELDLVLELDNDLISAFYLSFVEV